LEKWGLRMGEIKIKNSNIDTKNSEGTEIGVIKTTNTDTEPPPEDDNIKLVDKIIKNKGFVLTVLVLVLAIGIVYKI
jgi:hypothetical protein